MPCSIMCSPHCSPRFRHRASRLTHNQIRCAKLTLLLLLLTLNSQPSTLLADTVVVFNEIMYHPATNEANMEWVELHNQEAVDVDLSGWSITGGINYSFASNPIVRGRGFLVLASSPSTLAAATGLTNILGPFTGRLSNNGDTVRLRNNSGRIMDEISYGVEDDWPVAPDGSGVSLAKVDRDTASGAAQNWRGSDQMGGTPGTENFPSSNTVFPDTRLISIDAVWKYEASGTDLGTGWRDPAYNDSGWSSRSNLSSRAITGLFNTGVDPSGIVLANNTPDPHYVITVNAQGGTGTNALAILNHPAWLANDNVSSWIGIHNPGSDNVAQGNYNYQTTFSLASYILATVQINLTVAVDDTLNDVFINGVSSGFTTTGFAAFNPPFTLTNGFVAALNALEFRTLNGGTSPNPHGFRALVSGTALAANTNAPLPLG